MKRILRIGTVLGLILGSAACTSRLPAVEASDPTQVTPEHSYPLTTRTGMDEIDRVLEASRDADQLRSLIQFTSARCTTLEGLGGPPKCRPGEEDGALVEVLPFLGPEGYFLRKEEIRDWPGFEPHGILAIYEVSAAAFSDENYPAGTYAILFAEKKDRPIVSLRVTQGRIVRVDTIFDSSPEGLDEIVQREAAKLILAPLKN